MRLSSMSLPRRRGSLSTVWVPTTCTQPQWWRHALPTGLTTSMRMFLQPFDLVFPTLADRYRTGETPWIKLIIEKYHETAKANGAIVSSTIYPHNHIY